jgi:hypothetical protein
LEERTSSIFRVEERTKDEISMKEAASFFHAGFLLTYASTLKIEAMCSSETPVEFQWTTQRYIPENRDLHNHRCENLKSFTLTSSFCNQPGAGSGMKKAFNIKIEDLIMYSVFRRIVRSIITVKLIRVLN